MHVDYNKHMPTDGPSHEIQTGSSNQVDELIQLHGLHSKGKLIDFLVSSLGGKSIRDQLLSRKIYVVRKYIPDWEHASDTAVMDIVGDHFEVGVHRKFFTLPEEIREKGSNWERPLNAADKSVRGIGHEIAHTFFFDIDKKPPVLLFPGQSEKGVEVFCHIFSDSWADRIREVKKYDEVVGFLSQLERSEKIRLI